MDKFPQPDQIQAFVYDDELFDCYLVVYPTFTELLSETPQSQVQGLIDWLQRNIDFTSSELLLGRS